MSLALVPPDEHAVLVLLCGLAALLATAKGLGWVATRFGQPAVIGELTAGLVLGPSLLGRIAPGVQEWLFPDDAVIGAALYAPAWLGLLLLLAATGFESDLAVMRALGRPALLLATFSLLVPLASGTVLGILLPESLWGPQTTTTTFAAFFAVALSISSLPVVAKVLAELGVVRRNIGQLILAVAMANDVIGWVLLGVVAGLAQAGTVDAAGVIWRVATIIVFLGAALTVGQRFIDRALRAVADTTAPATGSIAVVFLIVIASGALTQAMGVEAVLGAFVAGIVVGRSRWRDERVLRFVDQLGTGLLAPIFFATAGLRVDLSVFADAEVALWTVVILAVATAAKFGGAVVGAGLGGLPGREQLAAGVALNARGALEIVIASVGVSIGVLNTESYGAIVIMAIVTSLAAPPLLRALLADWPGSADEQARLEREAAQRTRLLVSAQPPILLSRGRPASIVAAQIIAQAWPPTARITILTPADHDLDAVRNVLAPRPLDIKRYRSDLPSAVQRTASKAHGAIVIGITDDAGSTGLPPLVTEILATATVPVVLVRRERITGEPLPPPFAKAVIPMAASIPSQVALELGSLIAADLGTHLTLLHVDPSPFLPFARLDQPSGPAPGEALLHSAAVTAAAAGAPSVTTIKRNATTPASEVLSVALELDADLLIVATTRRQGPDGPQLGPIASHALSACPTTVVAIVVPPAWTGGQRH